MADGSIIFETSLDNKELEKELRRLIRRIQSLDDQIYVKQRQKMPLVEQSKQLAAQLDAAKAKLDEMQNGDRFYTSSHIDEQARQVEQLQKQWDSVQDSVEKCDSAIAKANLELERAKERAGVLAQNIAQSAPGTERMSAAMERAQKSARRFALRLREVIRSALIFTLISQSLAALRTWIGKVIRSNNEASVAIARLKGALLTMVQPLVNFIIPAFTAFVNVLTRIISTIAQLFAMLTGTTVQSTKTAAKALDQETRALDGTGKAAEKAQKSMAGFDEINQLDTSSGSGSGGGAASGIEPDFGFSADLSDSQLKNILGLIEAIGTAFLTWKISSALGLNMKQTLWLALAIYSGIQLVKNIFDAWINGVNWDNLIGSLLSVTGLVAGLYFALGSTAAGIGLVVSGLAMLVTGFHDAAVNGWNLQNTLMSIAGIMATGIGIGVLTGSFIPILIAAIASLVLAFTVATGHGEELISGIQTVLDGFKQFFTGIFTGDIGLAIQGIGTVFEGLKTVAGAVLDGIRDAFISFLDWLDEKTGGRLHGIITAIKELITGAFENAKLTISGILDSLRLIFQGITEFISGVFTQDWDKAWEGIKDIFKGVANGVISVMEGMVNFIITGLNWLISQMNKISFEAPDWVPGIGGKTIGINIPSISRVDIPRLAQGAVIPPNREFLAVLGDQKRGTNVEAPLETIQQALAAVMQQYGGNNVTITVKPEPGLTRYLKYELDAETMRRGGRLVRGVV